MRATLDRAAVNKGWGKLHPEYYFGGPYGTVPTRNPSRGGKKIRARKPRLNPKMLRGCGYTDAALEGYGYTDAALQGYGYTDAALEGYGLEGTAGAISDATSAIISNLDENSMKFIYAMANKLNTSVTQLLSDPDKCIRLVKQYAPKVAATIKKVWTWFKGKRAARRRPKTKAEEYLQSLRETDPEAYEKTYKQLQQKAWEEYQKKQRALFFADKQA